MAPLSTMMKTAVSASVGLSFVLGFDASSSASFDDYMKEHDLEYTGDEKEERKSSYHAAVSTVQAHNANPSHLWKMGINRFTVLSPKEMEANFGYMKKTKEGTRDVGWWGKPCDKKKKHTGDLPEEFDWRSQRPNVVTPVKSQGGCGSCWAFASLATMESAIAIATGVLFDLSPQQLTSCAPNPEECGGSGGCSGSTSQLAFNYTIEAGLTTIWSYPYLSGTTSQTEECKPLAYPRAPRAGITGYEQLPPNDAEALLAAVNVNPVSVSVAASSDLAAYSSGIFTGCSETRPIINHVVVLMGYGVENGNAYWLIRNSWGARWGELGHIRLLRRPGNELCGEDDKPLDGSACTANPPEGSVTACGMCGVLFDSAYPTGAYLGTPEDPEDPAVNDMVSDDIKRGITELTASRSAPLAAVAAEVVLV